MGGQHRVPMVSGLLALHDNTQVTMVPQLRTLSKSGAISVTISILLGFQFAVDNGSVFYVLLQSETVL